MAAPQSLDGLWLTDGYGRLLEFQGNTLRTYEITTLSCIPGRTAARQPGAGSAGEVVFSGDGGTARVRPAKSPGQLWLHNDGSVSDILLRRASERPAPCGRPAADTPQANYEIFWETFAEHYPFFALRKVDWRATDQQFRPHVTAETTPPELFRIFTEMIEPLHDAHTGIRAASIDRHFGGYRPSADPMQRKNAARITEIIESRYVAGGLRDFCNKQLQFGMLRASPNAAPAGGHKSRSAIGYLRIHSFSNYSADREFVKQLAALESALDDMFRDAALAGLVIDVRINDGGSDVFGVSIASRLTKRDYLAYSKVIRNDIHDPDHRTPPQPVTVHASRSPGFRGPVILLTGPDSVSAAETFTMALLDRRPHVTRVGASTQGVFSDVLGRMLPNGWNFRLPNEIYLTRDGKAFDGSGVPPDVEIPVFPAGDIAASSDSALDKALDLLAAGR